MINTNETFHRKSEIVLPKQAEHIPYIAVDIGGSLAKVVYFTKHSQGISY
jgi:hypothetical protein